MNWELLVAGCAVALVGFGIGYYLGYGDSERDYKEMMDAALIKRGG